MGFSSPPHNVNGHSTNRPPIVIFVMCLLLFACATLAMAFYIQYADVVLNPEIRANWKKFLSRLDSLDLCASIDYSTTEEEVNALSQFIDGGGGPYNTSSEEQTVSITVAASLVLSREYKKFPEGMIAATGQVFVDGLPKAFRDGGDKSSLNMTFVIPRNLTETSYKDTCVILTGPSWLLPLSRRSNMCIPSSINKTITHVAAILPMNATCSGGSSLKLSYNNQSGDEFYLSKDERWNIYIRLICASYFLFIVAVTFMCYALIRGRMYASVVKVDKIPLTL